MYKKAGKNLIIEAEKVYGKEIIDELRDLIFDIGWAIFNDSYLIDLDK